MRHFVPGKANNGLVGLSALPLRRGNDASEYIYPGIIRGGVRDSARRGEGGDAGGKGEDAACGFSEFAANAESAGAIGISSVVVLLDLTIHRL